MAEKEYIEREALQRCRFIQDEWGEWILAEDIINLPAADVRPVVRGKWIIPTIIDGRAFSVPHCSVCDGVPCGVDEHTHFCPNCGADMREEN